MTKVINVLNQKGNFVWCVNPENTVFEAIKIMDEKGVGALVVLNDTQMVGIISERDYARNVILKGRSSTQTRVKDIMTRKVLYTVPEQDISECMAVMSKHCVRHLPVISNNDVVGMLSLGDVVKEIIAEQQYKIESLEHSLSWGESY